MRSLFVAVAALGSVALAALSGCAHTIESRETSGTVVAVPQPAPAREVIAVDEQAPREEAPRARPRLTQTITLGQSSSEYAYSAPTPPPGQTQAGGSTQNVIVNNNVIVHQPPAVYGGYGYGYGYGYGSRGSVRSDGWGRGSSSRAATWGSTGWEGAQGRPAAPGATPSVGGNWAPAPSFGPRQMK